MTVAELPVGRSVAGRLSSHWHKHRSEFSAVTALTVILIVVVVVRPVTPDLIAQLARAGVSKSTGNAAWWTHWYGGTATHAYSLLSPLVMGVLQPWGAGAAAVAVSMWSTLRLVRRFESSTGLIMFLSGLGLIANFASGRITFAIGLAFALFALEKFLEHRIVWAVPAAVASVFASALAGFFLGVLLVAMLRDARHRKQALIVSVALLVSVGIDSWLFPTHGYQPMDNLNRVTVLLAAVCVWFSGPDKYRRSLALLFGAAAITLFFIRTPIGTNIVRLPLLFGPAFVLAGTAPIRRRAVVCALLLMWNVSILVGDLQAGAGPASQKNFYASLISHVPTTEAQNNRIEVVDPATHGPALFVANEMPLARGWERQVDAGQNPLFYDGGLDAMAYRTWLDSMAVRWVAVPNAPLDYASKAEAKLVNSGLSYLKLRWSDPSWQLYEVDKFAPLADGPASETEIKPDSIVITSAAAGSSHVKVTWMRGLALFDANNQRVGDVENQDGQLLVHFDGPGTYTVRAA